MDGRSHPICPLLANAGHGTTKRKASGAVPHLRRLSMSWYNLSMKSAKTAPVLERLVAPLGECLTPESARRLLALKADSTLQARLDYLADRHNQGSLTPEEQAEYGKYVSYGTFIAILKSKARQLLAASSGE
jgi:hypothetical protein